MEGLIALQGFWSAGAKILGEVEAEIPALTICFLPNKGAVSLVDYLNQLIQIVPCLFILA
jgi:hypothetical protein